MTASVFILPRWLWAVGCNFKEILVEPGKIPTSFEHLWLGQIYVNQKIRRPEFRRFGDFNVAKMAWMVLASKTGLCTNLVSKYKGEANWLNCKDSHKASWTWCSIEEAEKVNSMEPAFKLAMEIALESGITLGSHTFRIHSQTQKWWSWTNLSVGISVNTARPYMAWTSKKSCQLLIP